MGDAVHGPYRLLEPLARGGAASVHLAVRQGSADFRRVVAVKRLHAELARDPQLVKMFLDEGRIASRVRHPNVVPVIDITAADDEVWLVMELVLGESLAKLSRGAPVKPAIAAAIAVGMLHGLHAVHELTGENAEPLDAVHRDVSPQNVVVGLDGVPRLLDFGIAKSRARLQDTREGQVKGKVRYMAPEQVGGETTRAVDIYSAAVVLWELLTGRPLIEGQTDAEQLARVLRGGPFPAPSVHASDVPAAIDRIVARGLARDAGARFASARDMAEALEREAPVARAGDVGSWVDAMAGARLRQLARRITEIERMEPRELDIRTPALATVTSVARGGKAAQKSAVSRAGLALSLAVVIAAVFAWRGKPAWRGDRGGVAAPGSNVTADPPPPTASGLPSSAAPEREPLPQAAALTAAALAPSSRPLPIARPGTGPSSAPTAAARPSCDPPYAVDADGYRHFKRECFAR